MPDLHCPRCGNAPNRDGAEHVDDSSIYGVQGWVVDWRVYRCTCGPLCVVEGESVTWYVPMSTPLTTTATRAIVRRLFARYGFDADIATLLGELERRPKGVPADAR